MEDIYEGKLQALQKRYEDLRSQKDEDRFQLEEKVRHTELKMASGMNTIILVLTVSN